MAKKVKKAVKKTAKKVVKKVLDSTTIDEKVVAEYKKNKSLYDLILCYIKCQTFLCVDILVNDYQYIGNLHHTTHKSNRIKMENM